MFKKLKEKIAEEVKPLKISQFAQSVVTPGSNAVVESPPNEHFSLDDEPPEDSFGNEGFSVVDLHHPSLPVPLSSGRFSRQSSMSSLASDASAFLPIHDASIGTFNMQDLESASEREDVLPQMNNVSKQELCNSYLKLYRHYQKYKGRATDLKNFCRELEKDNKKHKTVLLECQEKSLRRIAELKEQCALEQHAKAHLEEALRNDLEEKDHLIQTLQTKIKLLKDAHSANSSALIHVEDENLLLIPGGIGEDCKEDLSVKGDDIPRQQELRTESLFDMKLDNSYEENEIMALKNRFENLKAQILKDSSTHIQDFTVNVEFHDLLNEISECLRKKLISPPRHFNEHKSYSSKEVDGNICISENDKSDSNLLLLDQLEQNLSDTEDHSLGSIQHLKTALENVPLHPQNLIHILDQGTSGEVEGSTNAKSVDDLPELRNELTDLQNKFEKVTQELQESHQLISEQNSTITKLNEKLATLEGQLVIYTGKENIETIKTELIQTKQELDIVQQQLLVAQKTVEEKDCCIKESNKLMTENVETKKLELMQTTQELEKVQQLFVLAQQTIEEKDHIIKETNEKMKENVESIKSELMQTKQELEKIQQQIIMAQQTIQEKDNVIKETKDALEKSQQDLDEVVTQKTEISNTLLKVQSELANTKSLSEELTHKLLNYEKEILKKESIIDHLNKEIDEAKNKFEVDKSENNKRNEVVRSLEIALSETNLKCEQISNELELQSKLIEEKDLISERIRKDLSHLHKDIDMVSSEKDESDKLVSALQTELKDVSLRFEEATEKLLSFEMLLKEKDDLVEKTKEELTLVQQQLDTASHEKVDATTLLQKQLTDANFQLENLKQELLLAQQKIDSKDSDIVNIQACLESVQGDMETVSSRAKQTTAALQGELHESKAQSEELAQKLHDANKSIDEKNSEIVNLRQDLESIKSKMETVSSQNVEKCETVKVLESDLTEAKVQLSKVLKETDDLKKLIQEKDLIITCINDELAAVHKNLEITLAQKTEACEERTNLDDKVAETNRNVELLTEKLQSALDLIDEKDSNYAEVCEKLSDIRKELDTTKLEKAKAEDNVAYHEKELRNMSANFKKLTEELECSSKLLEERDFKIAFLMEDAASIRETLNKMGAEKEEFNEKLSSLKKELTTTKLQFEQVNQEMQSVCHANREKDLTIAHVTEKFENSKRDLDIMSLQKSEACGLVKDLQDELKEASVKFDHVSKELQEVQESIANKDSIIDNLTTDLMTTRNELASVFALKDESCEQVSCLQKELEDSKLGCDKVSEELKSTHELLEEKDLYIKQLTVDLVKIQEELNKTCILNSEANKNVENLQSELKEMKINFERVCSESTNQLDLKKSELHVAKNVVDVEEINGSVLTEETQELVIVLQNKLKNSEQELENMVMKLETSQKSVNEKDIVIKKLEEELAVIQKQLRTSDTEEKDDGGPITRNNLENVECIIENNLSNQIDLHTRTISHAGQPGVDSSELCTKNMWRRSLDESGSKMKSDNTVGCINEQERSRMQRQKFSANGSSLSSVDKTNPSGQENIAVSSDILVNLSTFTSHIANRIESSSVSENHSVRESVLSSEEPSSLSGEVKDNLVSHKKLMLSDLELSPGTDADIPVETKTTSRNSQEALPTTDLRNKPQDLEYEFSSIQNILDEIQKENKEYGSLLDCHKNIINHLEGISKMQPEEINPGSAEWLHKQLIMLSQKLYDTKEKQSVQIASINRLVKHQQDLMKSDDNETMTIEMQYLRNIVFQYMIGKETMLLAKVISAVMKFDPQQMDQVMQKELQKQTLLGQLGLL
ncbi:hypothetical protein R5R35_014115 [Gryllus longicercus]|uniref:GRIP domain-containing protein n=1 Tax=Gryllus longicercus TaxID=2509291 RepID=A0AAN9UZT8_9ORTH